MPARVAGRTGRVGGGAVGGEEWIMPPTFRKSPPELVARFAELAEQAPDAVRKQVFGYPALVVGGNMFMALHQESLILRLSDDDRSEFAQRFGPSTFEPMPGRPMREYVVVPSGIVEGPDVDDWIARALAYANRLPPKS
jgi:TfoX N-terminal domain